MSQPSSVNPRRVPLLDEQIHEYLQQVDEGQTPDRAAILQRHPELAGELAAFFEDQDRIARFAQQLRLQETIGLAAGPAQGAGAEQGDPDESDHGGGLPRSVRYFGRYEILEEIARGGMGVVYKARQSRLDRVVALKMILTGQLASNADVARFYSEAQAAANLEHPGIVPIYEVGQYGGQHYFSMAYVEGESLAMALTKGPLPPREAAVLIQRICEAVQYAHERGVIHRDLKPANVLIDFAGQPRITDFGLAKHTGADSGLTATGQVLGTPSFMPPEQAAGDMSAIGPAADVYSLGAVLYAALTGRPPFQAATPLDTLMQVRSADPVSPRLVNPAVSRDLETICLKCLEKEPERRYASAAEMAEDLRRFLADEPIIARRQSPLAQVARWARKHRRTVTLVLGSIAAAAAVLIGGFFAWRSHEQAKLGSLSLSTDGPSLVAELFDDKWNPVGRSIPIPSSQPVELPEGSYRARVSSPGIVSETYSVDVPRGQQATYNASLEDRSLWPPLEMTPDDFIEPIELPGRGAGLLRYRGPDASFRLLDGATGKPVWPQDLVLNLNNLPAGEDLQQWSSLLSSGTPWSMPPYAIFKKSPDAGSVMVIGSRRRPALVAVSAETGKLLWHFRSLPTVAGVKDPSHLIPLYNSYLAPVIGKPVVAVADDGKQVVLAVFFSNGETFKADGNYVSADQQQIWIEALSAETGKSLWRHPIKTIAKSGPQNDAFSTALEAIEQPQVVKVGERSVVLVANDNRLYGFDLSDGKDVWPALDLGFLADTAPKIVVDPKAAAAPIATFVSGRPRSGTFPQFAKLTLTGISLDDRRQLWQTPVDGLPPRSWPHASPDDLPPFELASLEPAAAPVIVAPIVVLNSAGQPTGETAITVVDAASGKVRWSRTMLWSNQYSNPTANIRWTIGPDLDGDGYREIFAAWIGNEPQAGYSFMVAALSGRDGRTLWRWMQKGASPQQDLHAGLCWWTQSSSGFPRLVVPIRSGLNGTGQGATMILDSAAGSLLETLPEVSNPRSADLDGDGLPDLYYTVKPQGYPRLMTVRGAPPTAWRRLDFEQLQVAGDLNGDGTADLLFTNSANNSFSAISGRDGTILWRSAQARANTASVSAVPAFVRPGGAGSTTLAPAILVLNRAWDGTEIFNLRALFGRDGREVWPDPKAGSFKSSFAFQTGSTGYRYYKYPGTGAVYLTSQQPDAWIATKDPNNPSQVMLHVASGATGKLKWSAPFALGMFGDPGKIYREEFADLNGDGVADVVGWGLPANAQSGQLELKAFSGADGAPLWKGAPPVLGPDLQGGAIDPPLVSDLEGKGEPTILFTRQLPYDQKKQGAPYELVAVAGRDASIKWTWRWQNVGAPLVPPLAVALDNPRQRCVCFCITEVIAKNGGTVFQPELVILEPNGKLRRRINFKGNAEGRALDFDILSFWRKADLLDDGREQVLINDESALQAIGGAEIEPMWKWPLPDSAKLLDILPGDTTAPTTIAVWTGKSVYGISGPTGRPRWRGEMPTRVATFTSGPPEQVLLPDENGPQMPGLLAANGCRLTWPTDDSGRYSLPTPKARTYEIVNDPVRIRRLPWVPGSDIEVWMLVSMAFWAVLWLLVPWLLLRATARRVSWWPSFIPAVYQLATVLTLNQIPPEWMPWISPSGRLDPHFMIGCVSLFLLVVNAVWRRRRLWLTVDASVIYAIAVALAWSRITWSGLGSGQMPNGEQPIGEGLDNLIGIFTFAIPTIAAVWLPAIWIRRRQWRRLAAFLVVSLILGAAGGTFMLFRAQAWMPDTEQYSLDGCWWIIAWGMYFASLATLLAWLARATFRGSRTAAGAAIGYLRRRRD